MTERRLNGSDDYNESFDQQTGEIIPKKGSINPRRCLACNEVLHPSWARRNRKYCDDSCKMSYWYDMKYKKFYDERYKRLKREWERSDNGKRAGIGIKEWLSLPKDWR